MTTPDDQSLGQVNLVDKVRDRLALVQQQWPDRPYPRVTLTYAQSVDGCIARFGGGTVQLSSSQSQQLTHQLRAMHDAILIGINTVICDNPQLTVRYSSGKNPQPIVLDSRLRFPLDAKLLGEPCVQPIIATSPCASDERAEQLNKLGARVIRVPLQDDDLIDWEVLLPQIRQMGFGSVMVEGGAEVITSLLCSQLADQVLLAIAPRYLGGFRSVNPIPGAQLPTLRDVHYQEMGGDVVVWGIPDWLATSNPVSIARANATNDAANE